MRNVVLLFALVAMFGTSQVFAQTVTITSAETPVNATQQGAANAPAPAGTIFDFFVTTSGDILSVNQVEITVDGGSVFNNTTLGSDTGENVGLSGLAGFEGLQADSWISTPDANITILGGGFDPLPNGDDLWGDAEDDGPQTNFQFARITLTDGATGVFSGRVSIANGVEVFDQPFSFALGIPEPTTLALAGFGLIGVLATRRRSV